MRVKHIIFQYNTEELNIVTPGTPPNDVPYVQWIEIEAKRYQPAGATRVATVDMEDLPFDGLGLDGSDKYRECWRWNGLVVTIDMPLARNQRLEEIRAERNRRLVETDWQAIRAWEHGIMGLAFSDNPYGIYRQKLRDIPQTIDLDTIKTTEKLAAFEPDWPKL